MDDITEVTLGLLRANPNVRNTLKKFKINNKNFQKDYSCGEPYLPILAF